MSESKKTTNDHETILMALDQISQTIDVMTSVVGRLRTYLQEQESVRKSQTETATTHLETNSTVH